MRIYLTWDSRDPVFCWSGTREKKHICMISPDVSLLHIIILLWRRAVALRFFTVVVVLQYNHNSEEASSFIPHVQKSAIFVVVRFPVMQSHIRI